MMFEITQTVFIDNEHLLTATNDFSLTTSPSDLLLLSLSLSRRSVSAICDADQFEELVSQRMGY